MGMECFVSLSVKLNSGRTLVNECVCLWCKNWDLAHKVCEIVGVTDDYQYHEFILKPGELKELRDTLLNMCEDEDCLDKQNYDASGYISSNYSCAAELTKIMLLRDKKLPVYELFPKEINEDNYDPDDNVIKTEVTFVYSP